MFLNNTYMNMYKTTQADEFVSEMQYRTEKYTRMKNICMPVPILANLVIWALQNWTRFMGGFALGVPAGFVIICCVIGGVFAVFDKPVGGFITLFGGLVEMFSGLLGFIYSIPCVISSIVAIYAIDNLSSMRLYYDMAIQKSLTEQRKAVGAFEEDNIRTEVEDFGED